MGGGYGGGMGGYPMGGMGGGYGGGMGGYPMSGMGGGYGGGMSGMGPSMGGMGSQFYPSQQQGMMGGTNVNQNDPATVLAYTDDLNLTDNQVQRLEKMLNSGNKHATVILTSAQKKKLKELVGPKPGRHPGGP